MVPLFGSHAKSTTVIRLRECSIELQGLSKVGIQVTLVFLICLMSWGGRLFLKGDRRLDLFCFTKLQVPFEGVLIEAYKARALEENTICNLNRLVIQLDNMDSCFYLNLVHGTEFAFAEAESLAVFRSNILTN